MYISIDMDRLTVMHKHADHMALSTLAWLEMPNRSVTIENLRREGFLGKMSELDVRMLYKNTCQRELPTNDVDVLRSQLVIMLEKAPCARVVTEEVVAQANAVDDRLHAGESFVYAYGATTPASPRELFPVQAAPLSVADLRQAAENAVAGRHHAPAPPPPPMATTEPDSPAKAAKRSGVRQVVYAAAEAAWAERGGADWQAVRKALIAQLEADGYHPTTIRIKLSEWAKKNDL